MRFQIQSRTKHIHCVGTVALYSHHRIHRILIIVMMQTEPATFICSIHSTLRLTLFMTLKMINHCTNNNKLSLLSNIDATFNTFNQTPSAFAMGFNYNVRMKVTHSKLLNHARSKWANNPLIA